MSIAQYDTKWAVLLKKSVLRGKHYKYSCLKSYRICASTGLFIATCPVKWGQIFHVKHPAANVNRLSMIRNELSCLRNLYFVESIVGTHV